MIRNMRSTQNINICCGSVEPVPLTLIMIHQDIDKSKRALATLQEEKQAQKERIQLAIDTKRKFDADLHAHCQIPSAKERYGLR